MTLPLIADISTYGGPFADALPQQDPATEVAASAFNQVLNDCSAMTATACRAMLQFTGSATTPVLASTSTWAAGYDAVWGNAPALQPTFVRNSQGKVTITLPATVPNQIGNTLATNIRWARASLCSSSTIVPTFSVSVVASNSIQVVMHDSGSLSDMAGALIVVEVF